MDVHRIPLSRHFEQDESGGRSARSHWRREKKYDRGCNGAQRAEKAAMIQNSKPERGASESGRHYPNVGAHLDASGFAGIACLVLL